MNSTRRIAAVLTLAALSTLDACAGATRSADGSAFSPTAAGARTAGSIPGRIVAADLTELDGVTALDAVRKLRPEFLHTYSRQTTTAGAPPAASVYENDRYAGGIDVLNLIPMRVVLDIQRIDAVEARSRFGSSCRCEGGVILVHTNP